MLTVSTEKEEIIRPNHQTSKNCMVYIEVQDQRPLEIELLLSFIRNPRGIHFGNSLASCYDSSCAPTYKILAGDTAQSISKDALFRFANAKALFYTRFSKLDYIEGNKTLLKPTLLPLSKNFRSHQGILSLASLIMELMYTGRQVILKYD